ncbi:MAG: hypothetical protein QME71_02965 [Dehalococcoidia bacterium]|nr:hypothetical protein [Dehalococcoidia bacterium]
MSEKGISEEERGEEEAWDDPVIGEQPDGWTKDALRLAHNAIRKFPELRRRHRRFAGPVAVLSTGLVLLAGIAVTRRLRRGESPEEILDEVTSEEIENAVRLDEDED